MSNENLYSSHASISRNIDGNQDSQPCFTCIDLNEAWKGHTRGAKKPFFVLHVDINTFWSMRKEQQKILNRLAKFAAALCNTDGGEIIVHFNGQLADDRNLKQFDEVFGRCIEELIDDGELFHDVYKRYWMSETEEYRRFTDCIVICVAKTQSLATVDFNTKISNDFENSKPISLHILSLLSRVKPNQEPRQILVDLNETRYLYKSRNIEVKSFKPKQCELQQMQNDAKRFVDYLWFNLKLRHNITSMSKVSNGGTYFLGVSCDRNVPSLSGFKLPGTENEIIRCLKEKIKLNITVLHEDRFEDTREDFVSIRFHQLDETMHGETRHVLEIAVRQTNGIVFYEKEGPRTYVIENGETKRMDKYEWLKRMNTFCEPLHRQN